MPVQWEDGWPIVSPGNGRIELSNSLPDLPFFPIPVIKECDHFDSPRLDYIWNFIRTPREQFWSLTERPGYLRLKLKTEKITKLANPSFIGRRQQHFNFQASTIMEFQPKNSSEAAGIVLIQSNDYHFRFEYGQDDQQNVIRLIQCEKGSEKVLAEQDFMARQITLKIIARGQEYSFYYGSAAGTEELLMQNVNGRILSTDVAGGFVGTFIGLFASSNGQSSQNYADFDWFEYIGE
jgi:xylan 1,4-beta-xylosidase